jgi:hypothetical protein
MNLFQTFAAHCIPPEQNKDDNDECVLCGEFGRNNEI